MGDNESQVPVVVVKLSYGQEIVGKVLAHNESSLTLSAPLVVHMNRTSQETFGMVLLPFSFAGRQDQVTISMLQVVSIMEPDESFAKQYLAHLAGIDLVPASNMPKITL